MSKKGENNLETGAFAQGEEAGLLSPGALH